MRKGFTLAELLIALAILGLIAVFTIPKVLVAQQDEAKKAKAKEVASAISGALQAFKLENTLTNTTGPGHLTPYLNYVAVDTSSTVDALNTTATSYSCATARCLKMHQGGVLLYWNDSFCGTTTTNAISFLYDPDGTYSGSTTGTGKAIGFLLYADGRLQTYAYYGPLAYGPSSGTCTVDQATTVINPNLDPSWFSWD